jgi:hypothetical protein
MYTTEQAYSGNWSICDPDGDAICEVSSKQEADDLLSHLNRGN